MRGHRLAEVALFTGTLAGPQVRGAYVTMDTPPGAMPGSEGAAVARK